MQIILSYVYPTFVVIGTINYLLIYLIRACLYHKKQDEHRFFFSFFPFTAFPHLVANKGL